MARLSGKILLSLLVGGLLSSAAFPTAWAQFGLGKIKLPKKVEKVIPKTEETGPSPKASPETLASGKDSPEINMLSPDVAPPGGSLDVTLTGKAFHGGLNLYFSCVGSQFSAASVKVKDPTRAVARVKVPLDAQDGPCGINQKFTQSKEPFRISGASDIPVVLENVMYFGEGEMSMMDVSMKMSQVAMKQMQGDWQEKETEAVPLSGLVLAPATVKYVDHGNAVFEKPISSVKAVNEMKMQGQATGVFRIVFSDGAIHNFGASGQGEDQSGMVKFIRNKLGK